MHHHQHHHHHSRHHEHRQQGAYDKPRISKFPRLQRETERDEYHLTAQDGDLHSRTMLLNGQALSVDSSGNIPALEPIHVSSSKPIVVRPHSIVFAHMPYVNVPACQ